MPPQPWWVRLLAVVTGKTETQVAWRIRNLRHTVNENVDASREVALQRGVGAGLVRMLPESIRPVPATFAFGVGIVLWYLVGVIATGGNLLAFSGYTIQHFGSTQGVLVHSGEWHRLLVSNFVHHDLIHLAFNLYALTIVGRLVEDLFGSAKATLGFVLTGIFAMALSHVYNTYFMGNIHVTSGGASGAICGLIGMAIAGGHRLGTSKGIFIRNAMARWAVYLVVFGFLIPFINNAAHFGGFLGGVALGFVLTPGVATTPNMRRLTWVAAVMCIAALGLQAASWNGKPAAVSGFPRGFFGFLIEGGEGVQFGSLPGFDSCMGWSPTMMPTSEEITACEHFVASVPGCREVWERLDSQHRIAGNESDLERTASALELPLRTCF